MSSGAEESRPGEAMADVPQKPSRVHCCDGLFHRPNAHFCSVLACFFVIGHDRRKILHFNVTRNHNALWVVQQLREAGESLPAAPATFETFRARRIIVPSERLCESHTYNPSSYRSHRRCHREPIPEKSRAIGLNRGGIMRIRRLLR